MSMMHGLFRLSLERDAGGSGRGHIGVAEVHVRSENGMEDLRQYFLKKVVRVQLVKFVQKLDQNNRIYIAKPLREAGFTNSIEILPNSKAAIIYRAGTKIDDILGSLEIIIADLKHRQNVE
jgi:hypothetical protein